MTPSDDVQSAIPGLIIGFVLALLVTLAVTPIVRRYARRLGVVDRPEARRVNTRIVARGGGIAIGFSFIAVSLLMLAVNAVAGMHFVDEPASVGGRQVAALLIGAAAALAIGFLDDKYQLRARWQFLGQFGVAGVAVVLGVVVTTINNPLSPEGIFRIPAAIVGVTTLLWIVGMVNSLNFIDGLDGLSSGIALIAALTLGVISLGVGTGDPEPYVALFCFILAGALAGFLRWNFHPARIFSGTSGIMFVGYSLAVLSILGAGKIAVALLVLGVPIMDTFWITVRRIASGRSPFAPDRGHIHHRLLDLGLSHRNTVLVIYGVCGLLAVMSLVLSNTSQMYAFLGLVVVFGLALFAIERLGGGAGAVQESLDADSYATDHEASKGGSPPDAGGSGADSAGISASTSAPRDSTSPPDRPDARLEPVAAAPDPAKNR
jgi:UDP-GlcNAc:undecaprenyl-phosphate GlcNAc-1-phosphate transferase